MRCDRNLRQSSDGVAILLSLFQRGAPSQQKEKAPGIQLMGLQAGWLTLAPFSSSSLLLLLLLLLRVFFYIRTIRNAAQ